MMAVGMLAQFGISLGSYLKGRAEARLGGQLDTRPESPVDPRGTRREKAMAPSVVSRAETKSSRSIAGWAFPLAVVVLSAAWLLSKAYLPAPQVGQMDLDAFGRLPIMFEGRIKPIDTLARNSLRIISDRQVFKDENGATQPAIRWLLDVITNSAAAEKHRVFRIQSLEVLDTLGLERRQGFRYAIEEFAPKLDVFGEQVRQARMTEPARRGLYEKKILELEERLNHYIMLRESFQPSPLRAESLREDLAQEANRREQNSNNTLPLAVPPKDPDGAWQPYSYAFFDARAQSLAANQGVQVDKPNLATVALAGILNAYGDKSSDAAAFNRGVQTYWELLREHPPQQWNPAKTDFEAYFNHFSPFYYAMILYMCAFLLGCFSWLGWSVPLQACRDLVDRIHAGGAHAGSGRTYLHFRSAAHYEPVLVGFVCGLGGCGAGHDPGILLPHWGCERRGCFPGLRDVACFRPDDDGCPVLQR